MSIRFILVAPILLTLAPQSVPAPGVRFGHSVIYDAQQRRVVLLDGYTRVGAVSPAEPPERGELWA